MKPKNELEGIPRDPKILLWDIETSYILYYGFGLFPDSISHDNIVKDWYMFCAAWRWFGKKKVEAVSLLDDMKRFKKDHQDDYHVVKTLHDILSEADAIIAHNGDRFDIKKFNTRAIIHGLDPLPELIQIDTLKMARKKFNFTSNRLDALGEFLGVGRKVDTPKGLWRQCTEGDIPSLKMMVKYNKGDITLLSDVFDILKPWLPAQVNMNLFKMTESNCPSCHSTNVQRRGFNRKGVGKRQRYHCQDCGLWYNKPINAVAR